MSKYFVSILLGIIGAWAIGKFASPLGFVDRPNERSSHKHPTPKGGGIGIFLVLLFISIIENINALFWLPVTIMAGVAFIGDRIYIGPIIRIVEQTALAGIMVIGKEASFERGFIGLIIIILMIVYIVGTANVFNFMDGINGIAGMTGIIGFALLALFLILSKGRIPFASVALCVSFGCLGFLPFNIPRAKVFMGDIGSILLGAAFSGIVYWEARTVIDFICMMSFLLPFYSDEVTTMYVRLRSGENLIKPHRRHIYQLLANEKGLPHWKISVGYILLQILVGACVIAARTRGVYAVASIVLIFFVSFVVLGIRIRSSCEKTEVHPSRASFL